jgi:hypothetical protein
MHYGTIYRQIDGIPSNKHQRCDELREWAIAAIMVCAILAVGIYGGLRLSN